MADTLDFSFRYITEDEPFGLVPTASLGSLLKIRTPTIDAEIQFASLINQVNFREVGNTVEKMGLTGKSTKQIMDYASTGESQ